MKQPTPVLRRPRDPRPQPAAECETEGPSPRGSVGVAVKRPREDDAVEVEDSDGEATPDELGKALRSQAILTFKRQIAEAESIEDIEAAEVELGALREQQPHSDPYMTTEAVGVD